jgi:hypothetical protein
MAVTYQRDVMVNGRALLAIVEEWLARGHQLYAELCPHHSRLVCSLRNGEREEVGLDTADRLLLAMGVEYRLAEIAPEPDPIETEEEVLAWAP